MNFYLFLFPLKVKILPDYLAHSSKLFVKSLLQNASKTITKRGKVLLQNAAAFSLQNASILSQNTGGIAKRVDFTAKCGRY